VCALSLGSGLSLLGALGHVAYLAVLAAIGIWAAGRTYRRRLYV